MKGEYVNRPRQSYGLLMALSMAIASNWGNMARMLTRSFDINGRERFNFDHARAHRQSLRFRRQGGKG